MRQFLTYNICCSGANDVDALNEIMRELENADDDADDGGSGDLLDDFVSTAAAQVWFAVQRCTSFQFPAHILQTCRQSPNRNGGS